MCLLLLETVEPSVAEQDITCYKVLRKEQGEYRTPCYHSPVSLGCMIEAALPNAPAEYNNRMGQYIIEGQGVHAYQTERKAYSRASIVDGSVVARCTIPAGTEYWLGWGDEIAARRMSIDEIFK